MSEISKPHSVREKLLDLHKQATQERSHFYTGAVVLEAIDCIDGLVEQLEAREKQLCEIAEKGYERILQKAYEDALEQYQALREAVAEAMTSLTTGPTKDGYAYHVLEEATTPSNPASEPKADTDPHRLADPDGVGHSELEGYCTCPAGSYDYPNAVHTDYCASNQDSKPKEDA